MMMRTSLRLAGGFLVLLAVAFGLLAFQLNTLLQPVDVPAMAEEQILVSIPQGSSSTRIANILEEEGLVRNATVFRFYAKFQGMDQGLQAGNYLLSYGMDMDEILAELSAGNVYRPTVSVTIPEGLTLEQIAQRLEDRGLADADEFMDLAGEAKPAMGQTHPEMRYAMEGYLFPDTYEFDEGVSAETILSRMQTRMEEVFTAEMRERAQELGLSLHEVMTLASLVEREVQAPQERETVAAVMHNRMAIGMPLQIDATVLYALGEHREQVLYVDLEVESPYNTYYVSGLPPGPIAAPGRGAIMAVLYPEDVDYLYYVLKRDGTGEHYFARTYAEHQQNIRRSRNNRQ
ncbi:aminodeoxychorismate lyase [Dethiobacter alkaliphilus AHT 1]|uniref:Endolytic murein transglycosylase n=2 Tax=Dethiobacter TaxID=427925 RepID=C0GKI1_DETAL|nr:aminodeoxychorismate lyase [Dethiobacter alkaliphilus AHT 1]